MNRDAVKYLINSLKIDMERTDALLRLALPYFISGTMNNTKFMKGWNFGIEEYFKALKGLSYFYGNPVEEGKSFIYMQPERSKKNE